MSDRIRDYRDLLIWQKAMDFATEVYRLSEGFPRHERFGLTSQLRRAAVSVPSNIAEGHARQGREFVNFISIARGSLAEAETQLLLAFRVHYVSGEGMDSAFRLSEEIKRMAAALTTKVQATY